MIAALLWLFNTVVFLYIMVIVVLVLMSWLTAFKVVDPQAPLVSRVDGAVIAMTNPVINPVRRIIPSFGRVDISPIIVVLLLEFVRRLVNSLLASAPG
jgi:YggT family protein